MVAPLTCQGLPAHTQIHQAGGDYAPEGDEAGFFAPDLERGFDEVMYGHAEPVAEWRDRLKRQETGMCEFHCVLVRRSVFDRIGPLDEKLLSTKEHIDFSMSVKASGGTVWFEPSSVVTYVFPCRARPLNAEDWPFFCLRWSDAYGRRSLRHFIAKWNLKPRRSYVADKRRIYWTRRKQAILIPIMRKLPVIGRYERIVRLAAGAGTLVERIINAGHVAIQDRQAPSHQR